MSTDEDTLRLSSFDKGRILIATEWANHIGEWIQLEVDDGVLYKIKVVEDI